MSDVMKQVVQEILQGNKTLVSRTVDQRSEKTNLSSPLADIKRPNYQRLKQEERLGKKQENTRVSSEPKQPKRTERKTSTSSLPKQFNEESISALRSISLAQGHVQKSNRFQSYGGGRSEGKARMIGKTRDSGYVWFFPQVNDALKDSFERPVNMEAVGVVTMTECLPSQLLLINEVIRTHQEIKFSVSWTREANGPFTAELYDEDASRLEKVMNDLYQKLNRRSLKGFETYTSRSPSLWLTSQLNISKSVEGIAFLEGIPYYTSIMFMDSLLKRLETVDFDFEVNRNYLLLYGNHEVISQQIGELKKEAARFITDARGG